MFKRKYLFFITFFPLFSHASIEFELADTTLKLYGDAEINIDGASKKGYLSSISTNNSPDNEKWDMSGRILVGLDGHRMSSHNILSGFSIQPLINIDGSISVDDATIYAGKKDEWQIKVGRYEAYDMFPLGQDTFIEYSGNTANDLYRDGFGYIYMMKEGRGRNNNGGAIQLSTQINNFSFELNTSIRDGTSLFDNNQYHGNKLENRKNVIYVRPIISWKNDDFSLAAAMESNLVNNAYGYYDVNDTWQDQSKRSGYGFTMSWNSVGAWSKAANGILVNMSASYLDAQQENSFTFRSNISWKNFSLGYIYANNEIKYHIDSNSYVDLNKYHINTIHTSYRFEQVLNIHDFDAFIGAYWSSLDSKINSDNNSHNRYGTRLRLKYYF